MALSFEIKGKTTIRNGVNVLGQTSNEDQIRVEERIFNNEIFTSESGPNLPGAVYNAGRFAIITVPFIEWDEALLDALYKAQGATNEGEIGVLGQELALFDINLLPAITGAASYTFPKCFVHESQVLENWSVGTPNKRIMTFKAIADPTALSTATTPIFTKGTV